MKKEKSKKKKEGEKGGKEIDVWKKAETVKYVTNGYVKNNVNFKIELEIDNDLSRNIICMIEESEQWKKYSYIA